MGQRGKSWLPIESMGGGGEWQKIIKYGSPGGSFSAGSPPFGLRIHIPSSEGQWWPVGLVGGREWRRCGSGDL